MYIILNLNSQCEKWSNGNKHNGKMKLDERPNQPTSQPTQDRYGYIHALHMCIYDEKSTKYKWAKRHGIDEKRQNKENSILYKYKSVNIDIVPYFMHIIISIWIYMFLSVYLTLWRICVNVLCIDLSIYLSVCVAVFFSNLKLFIVPLIFNFNRNSIMVQYILYIRWIFLV